MRTLVLTLSLSFIVGCTDSTTVPTNVVVIPRTIQMDDATLFINGDNWLFSFSENNRECFLLGVDVSFVDRKDGHVVVNLDLTETQKANGKNLGSYVLANVPTSGQHRVVVIRPGGCLACSIAIPDEIDPAAFIDSVLNNPKVKRGIKKMHRSGEVRAF